MRALAAVRRNELALPLSAMGCSRRAGWHGHVSTKRQQARETIHCHRGRWHASDEFPGWTLAPADSSAERDGPEDDARPRADLPKLSGGGSVTAPCQLKRRPTRNLTNAPEATDCAGVVERGPASIAASQTDGGTRSVAAHHPFTRGMTLIGRHSPREVTRPPHVNTQVS